MRILVSGIGLENFGSRLMLSSLMENIEGADWIIELPRNYYAINIKYILPIIFYKFGPIIPEILINKVLHRLGVVNLDSIDVVIDASGYIHDTESTMPLFTRKQRLFGTLNKYNIPILVAPHSYSGSTRNKFFFRELYSKAVKIYGRDQYTLEQLKDLGITTVDFSKDFVISGAYRLRKSTEDELLIIPNFKVDLKGFCSCVEMALKRKKWKTIKVVSFYRKEKKEEFDLLFNLIDSYNQLYTFEYSTEESEFSASLVISARFHGVCLAIYSQIDFMIHGWSEKYENLLKEYNLNINEDGVFSTEHIADLIMNARLQNQKFFDEVRRFLK